MSLAVDPATLETVGYYLIVLLFLGTAVVNSTTQVKQHRDRMVGLGVPFAGPVLWLGFALQYAGSLSLLFGFHREIGAAILIVFTIAATAIFHRFRRGETPLERHFHRSAMFMNAGIVGALLRIMGG